MDPKVKELLKSVHICQSYRKNKSGTFLWPTVYIDSNEVKKYQKVKSINQSINQKADLYSAP